MTMGVTKKSNNNTKNMAEKKPSYCKRFKKQLAFYPHDNVLVMAAEFVCRAVHETLHTLRVSIVKVDCN